MVSVACLMGWIAGKYLDHNYKQTFGPFKALGIYGIFVESVEPFLKNWIMQYR